MDAMKAGAKIVAGTDTPNAFSLHGEMATYVLAGMTPFQALQSATVNSAEALALDAGSIEAGKLADLVILEGDPLTAEPMVIKDIKVVETIKEGRGIYPAP